MKKDEGARYAIEVDGVVRTHRDDVSHALDAVLVLRGSPGNKMVRVVDTHTGQTVTGDARRGLAPEARTPLFSRRPVN